MIIVLTALPNPQQKWLLEQIEFLIMTLLGILRKTTGGLHLNLQSSSNLYINKFCRATGEYATTLEMCSIMEISVV